MARLTKWEGCFPDGSPKAELVKHDGPFAPILQEALAKLAKYEDMEEHKIQFASRVLALSQSIHCREDSDE